MDKKSIDFVKDTDQRDILNHIFENGMGTPIAFSSAPSLADMDANTWGYYSTSIYIKFSDGTGISIAGVAMT